MIKACRTFLESTSEESVLLRKRVSPYVKESDLCFITLFDYYKSCFLVLLIETTQWVGCWNMLTIWLWPWEEQILLRDAIYVAVGIVLRFICKRFFSKHFSLKSDWEYKPPDAFSWKRKSLNYASTVLSFLSFLFVWAGFWDVVDVQFLDRGVGRDIAFFSIPLLLLYVLEVLLSEESLLYTVGYVRSEGWKKEIQEGPKPEEMGREKEGEVIIDLENIGDSVLEADELIN